MLQDHAPFVDYTVVQKVIAEDLGAMPEELFRSFDKAPLAAASLAQVGLDSSVGSVTKYSPIVQLYFQVHHAVSHDGRELAVKVQYPTLRDEFSGDMFTHWLILNMADILFEGIFQQQQQPFGWCSLSLIFADFDLAWIHDELERNLVRELDFVHEAENSERCARNFKCVSRVAQSS